MKKLKKKHIGLLGILLSIGLIFLVWLGSQQQETIYICDSFSVECLNITEKKSEIEKFVFQEITSIRKKVEGKRLTEERLEAVEESIKELSYIESVNVFSKENKVFVSFKFREPIARIFVTPSESYYYDAQGKMFESAIPFNVLLVHGIKKNFTNKENLQWKHLFDGFLRELASDDFLRSQIVQVYFNSEDDITLIPLVGYQHIEFGGVRRFKKKMEKLKRFYSMSRTKIDINTFKTINLKFSGQVICETQE